MAKRFIDTKIWDKPWYRELTPETKLLWIYILTKCDHAGILDGDWEAASFFIGCKVSDRRLPSIIKDKMVSIDDDQYFIPSFVDYQYGILKENSKPHLSVINRLKSKGLTKYIKTAPSTVKYKYKDIDIDKREEKFKERVIITIKEEKYKPDEIDNFIGFWTERNDSNTKMRFELQQTFDISRRLATWVKNNKDWKINKKGKNERKEMHFTGS